MEREQIIIIGLIAVILVLVGAIFIVVASTHPDTNINVNNTTDQNNETNNLTNTSTSTSSNNNNKNSNHNNNGKDLSNYQCGFCGKFGHIESDCPTMITPGGHRSGTGAEGWYVDENGNDYYWEP